MIKVYIYEPSLTTKPTVILEDNKKNIEVSYVDFNINNCYKSEKPSRLFVRKLLYTYLNLNENDVCIKFNVSKKGKPHAVITDKRTKNVIDLPVHFSLSHSGDMLMCAISDENVGADCQVIVNDGERLKRIANRFFTEEEVTFLSSQKDIDYAPLFFDIWTRKEAYVKYTGAGLSGGLRTFSTICNGTFAKKLDDVRFINVPVDNTNYKVSVCV